MSESQDRLENDVVDVLATVALPEGFADAVEAAAALFAGAQGATERLASLASIEARQGRLRDLYELGDIERTEYLRRRDELTREAERVQASATPTTFARQRTTIRSLVDDWSDMTPGQRKRLLVTIFAEIVVGADGVMDLLPREGWRPYLKAALAAPRVLRERKTGLEPATLTLAR